MQQNDYRFGHVHLGGFYIFHNDCEVMKADENYGGTIKSSTQIFHR